jgi:diaminohydroxyphosphoribosylaminopyrimidine deaminase/5-amino-6-(5-phosphoribosylamino)uracil reductase
MDRSFEQYGKATWITNDLSRIAVHKMRADESAIIVGTHTAKKDNPSLTIRDWNGIAPLRLVIDRDMKLSLDLALFDQKTPTVVYTSKCVPDKNNLEYKRILFNGKELDQILKDLHERGILSLIVEGGQILLNSFISLNIWDEARVFTGKCDFFHGVKAPVFEGLMVKSEEYDDSWMFVFHNV